MKNKRTFFGFLVSVLFIAGIYAMPANAEQKDDTQHADKKQLAQKTTKRISSFNYQRVQKLPDADVATATGRVSFGIGLQSSVPYIGASFAHTSGFKGKGTNVVIIDTGIEKAHPFFQNRVIAEACFADVCPNGTDEMIGEGAAKPVHFHGTHVAGIAAGYNTQMSGVAPEVGIIAVNVFDPYGRAYDESIIRALQWVNSISNQYDIAAVNMSLGSGTVFKTTCDNYIPEMTKAIEDLKSKGIATVVSAGNAYSVGMSSPACISSAVSVAAMSTFTGKITTFSNVSQYTTLSAPGQNINSSKLLGSYGPASGTSMAAPHVTGAIALYRNMKGFQSVDKVVSDFQSAASSSLDEYSGIVTKRLDLNKLVDPNYNPPVTTTTLVTTTTTIPVTTTTIRVPVTTTTLPGSPTTTTIPSVTTTTVRREVYYINAPVINRIRQVGSSTFGITLRYYSYDGGRPEVINIYCTHDEDSGVHTFTTSFQYTGGTLLNYTFDAPTDMVKSCQAEGVASNGLKSKMSNYVEVTR